MLMPSIFGHHMAVGVHAEGAHLVAVLLGAVDQLGLATTSVICSKDGGGQLHPHPRCPPWLFSSSSPRALHWLENHSAPERPGRR